MGRQRQTNAVDEIELNGEPVAVDSRGETEVRRTGNQPDASQLSGNTICSSCRAREAAFGCEAVVIPADAACLTYRNDWFYDCFAAERSLAGSAAATQGCRG